MKSNDDAKVRDYTRLLGKGKENAISAERLAVILGFNDTRALRKDITRSRAAGQIICCNQKNGYYIPVNGKEIEEYIHLMEARTRTTFQSIKAAKRALKQIEGQLNIQDY